MADMVQIDREEIERIIPKLLKQANGNLVEDLNELAKYLVTNADDNKFTDQIKDFGKDYNEKLNEYANSANKFIAAFKSETDFADYIDKLTLEYEKASGNTESKAHKVDVGSLV